MKIFMYNQFKQHNENKMSSLGVGQIHLIKSWLDEMEIENYVINDDLTIDVNDAVYLNNKLNKSKLPDIIKFNKVKGYFSCSHNNLTSLEGCPTSVGGSFLCHNNKRKFTENEVKELCNVNGLIYT